MKIKANDVHSSMPPMAHPFDRLRTRPDTPFMLNGSCKRERERERLRGGECTYSFSKVVRINAYVTRCSASELAMALMPKS